MELLRKELISKNIDCAVFFTYEDINPNLFYLTGYRGAGALIILPNSKPILHVPSRDLSEAKSVAGIEISHGKKLFDVLKSLNASKIGTDFANTSVTDFNNLKEKMNCEFYDLTEFMNNLRAVKRKDEVSKIKKACKITDRIFDKFVKNFKNFKTEEEAAAFLVYESRKLGCVESFEPIVASGRNAAVPHHKSKGKIHKGFLVVDFGVNFEGYCSDVTRTFYVGKLSKEEEETYYNLFKEQERAISLVRPGKIIGDLCIDAEKNLKQKLIHSLGHGLGIEVHETPFVSINSKEVLKSGMVITIEPGEYIERKYGIRIEDDILVTKNGCEVLSKFSKKLIIIK